MVCFLVPHCLGLLGLLAAHELLCSTARLDVADVAEPSATLREYDAACGWLGRWPGLESVPMPSTA